MIFLSFCVCNGRCLFAWERHAKLDPDILYGKFAHYDNINSILNISGTAYQRY